MEHFSNLKMKKLKHFLTDYKKSIAKIVNSSYNYYIIQIGDDYYGR